MNEHTHTIENATNKLKEGAGELKDAVVTSGAEALKKYHSEGTQIIKNNPYTSVLVALGVGALIGILCARKS